MLRARNSRSMLCLVVTVLLAPAASARAESSWKLYDLRDLMAVIPPLRTGELASTRAMLESLLQPVTPKSPSIFEVKGSVDNVMEDLCDALDLSQYARLVAGVYVVEAEETEHALIVQMLEGIRGMYAEQYEVEIIWFSVASDQAPSAGSEASPVDPPHRHRLVAPRRTPTPLTRVSLHTYVAGLQPVVAQSAAAYDVQTRSIADGLQATILVGAGKEDAGSTSIQISGDLRSVTMGKTSAPITYAGSELRVDLPIVSVRSIQTNRDIEFGRLTVLTVVDDFEDGQCVVIAASVRKLDQ